MNLPQDGIKLHRGNFTAIGQQIQPYLEDGKCFRMVLKPWREKRSLSQNALSHMWYSEISEYWICPYISRHLLSLNPLLACCRRYSRGER